MPELPDIVVYLECLAPRVVGHTLERIRIASPFLVRSFEPAIESAEGRRVVRLRRLGKRIVMELEGDLFLVIHLMIAGRLYWREPTAKPPLDEARGRQAGGSTRRGAKLPMDAEAALHFDSGTLLFTEAGTKKRASMYLVQGESGLAAHQPGGLEVLDAKLPAFRAALLRENRTLKRALTSPQLFSGIGNAYSDEILHAARLSPVTLTKKLTDADIARLFDATRSTLHDWIVRTRQEFDAPRGFPKPGQVTAFRPGFAVHGKFGQPCPVCGTPVQRIVHADNETNYCPRCQTGGKVLADRSLSHLLKDDWPRTVEELES